MLDSLKIVVISICILSISCNNRSTSVKKVNIDDSTKVEKCISEAIAIDDKIGKLRNHNSETISLSETIRIYVSEIDKIDFSECPTDFKHAFASHKIAWVKMISITDKYPDLRGEMHDLFKILEVGEDKEEFKIYLDMIWSTWGDVEKSMNKN